MPDRRWRSDYVETARQWQTALRGFDGPRSMHGAFWHLHPASTEPEVVEFARKRHTQSIEAAAITGSHYLVLHSDVHARARAFHTGDDWTPILATYFRELAREAAAHGVRLLIENTFETDPRGL